jgi:hypothetical protein
MADAAWSPDDSRFRWRAMKGITLKTSHSFHGLGEYIAVLVASNAAAGWCAIPNTAKSTEQELSKALGQDHAEGKIHVETGAGL